MTNQEVQAFVQTEYGRTLTDQTLRNWFKVGRLGVRLPENCTEDDIRKFVKDTDALRRGRPWPVISAGNTTNQVPVVVSADNTPNTEENKGG